MNLEIETKARLLDKGGVVAQLISRGCTFTQPVVQDDTVYVRETGSLATFLSNDSFARIRIQNDGVVVLTVKKPINKSSEVLVKHEAEVVVSSAAEAERMLTLLGYVQAVHVHKIRRTGECEGFHVCIDSIEGLGDFIELEQMAHKSEADAIQARMRTFLSSLRIAPHDEVKKGYDILMIEKQGLK